MLVFWGILVFVLWLIATVSKAPLAWKKTFHREKMYIENALASHSCFESEKKYTFPKGSNTPKAEFYRRINVFKSHSGVVTQHVCYRIADDISNEIKSMRNHRIETEEEKTRAKNEAGKKGEQETMFHLRRLCEDGFFIKCNAVLYPYTDAKGQERAKTETDHLLVGRCGLVLVETKNIAGTITLNLRGWTQQKNGQAEESIGSAAAQNDRHKDYFRKFFQEHGLYNIPIYNVVAISNPKAIIRGEDPSCDAVVKSESLPYVIRQFPEKLDMATVIKLENLCKHLPIMIKNLQGYRVIGTYFREGKDFISYKCIWKGKQQILKQEYHDIYRKYRHDSSQTNTDFSQSASAHTSKHATEEYYVENGIRYLKDDDEPQASKTSTARSSQNDSNDSEFEERDSADRLF